jgi:hypothetical protein
MRVLFGMSLLALAAWGMLRAFPADGDDGGLAKLAAEFRAYREEMKQPPDMQRPELRKWAGPMHELMADLGERIGRGHYLQEQVVELLGPPNGVFGPGKRHHRADLEANETHLVYWWRGGHDYLYFVVKDGKVVEAKWWHAGE